MKHFSILFSAILFSFSLSAQTPVQKNGQVSVRGTKMYSANGNQTQLKGLSSHGIQWYDNCYTKASLQAIRDDWKADLFRITVYVNEDGYNKDTAKFIKRIDQIIGWCEELGMYYMVDWHVLTPGDPLDATYSKAKAFFSYMARKHGNTPNIMFEICNEPNPNVERGGPNWTRIKSYAEPIIAEIRKYSKNIVIVGTPQWNQMPGDVVGNEIKADNVMYSFHFYAASHSNLKGNLTSVCNKIPMFVTEWGIGSAQELENVVDTVEAYDWLQIFKKNKITWSYWSFSDKGNTASLLDSGACADKAWTKVNAAGSFLKKYLVSDAKMEATKSFGVVKSETDKDGENIILSFATKLKAITAENEKKFSITVNGKVNEIKSLKLSNDSSTLRLLVARKIVIGDVVKLSYGKGTVGSIENYTLIDYNNLAVLNTVPPPGVFGFEDNFDDNILSEHWTNTDDKKFTYTEANKMLKVSANYTEKGWIPFSFRIPTISLLHTPGVTITLQSDVDFVLRIDFADVNGQQTNMNEISLPIKASTSFQTYFFDFTGKFFQQYPKFGKVDQSKINTVYFYPNPGKSFSGTLLIDDVIIGKKP
jgi:endoglucanase